MHLLSFFPYLFLFLSVQENNDLINLSFSNLYPTLLPITIADATPLHDRDKIIE